jgi:hypothetical protein
MNNKIKKKILTKLIKTQGRIIKLKEKSIKIQSKTKVKQR